MAKRKRSTRQHQKPAPPRRHVGVEFPADLFIGIEAIAAMERWSLSKTVVEIVRRVLAPLAEASVRAAAALARELKLTAADLRVEELDDPRVRAELHDVRKTLDRLLDQAERQHHPCRA